MKKLFTNRLFIFGFSIISLLLSISLGYWAIFEDHIPTTNLLKDENGDILRPPYNGSVYPPLGTDEFGRNILMVMIVGFKYTILAGFLITFIRVIPSIFLGLVIHFYLGKLERPIKSMADSINYFPVTLLAYFMLFYMSSHGIMMDDPAIPEFWGRVWFFVFILSIIFIPTNSVLIANEVKKIYNMEFIESSRVLGANTWRIITKHIRPFLVPQLYIIFIREFIQTLVLMSHLGVLGIFIGGAVRKENLFGNAKSASISDEWTGLIGMWWQYLWTSYPWIAIIPILGLTLLIIAAKSILEGIKEVIIIEEKVIHDNKQTIVIDPDIPPFQLLLLNKERERNSLKRL